MCDFIRNVPDAVWAAIIASLLTLGGVVLTNIGSSRRLLMQLKNEKDLRDREREMSLRREVYLKGAESVNTAISAIVKISDINISNEQLGKDISDGTAGFGKIHVVGNEKTVFAVSTFSSELSSIYLRLIVKRYPLIINKSNIAGLEGLIEKASRERDKLIEMMKEVNIRGIIDKRLMDLLNNNFEFEGKQMSKWKEEKDALFKDLYAKQIELFKECTSCSAYLSSLLIPALMAIREELELPLDEDKYTKMIADIKINQEKALSGFLKDIQNLPNA